MNQSVSATGMVWFKRENFARLRVMFEDGHKLHRTYDQWLAAAELGRKGLEAKGMRVVCVDIDPHDFPVWCKAKGKNLDANGRNAYAAWVAYKVITGVEPPDVTH